MWQHCADEAQVTPLQPASGGQVFFLWYSPQKMHARKEVQH